MYQLLIVVALAVHLLAMNLASAGPLYCIGLRGLRSPASELRNELGRSLAWLSLVAFVLGMITGGFLLLVPPSSGLVAALGRFPARAYWMASSELMFTFACLTAYAMCWKKLRRHPVVHAILPLLSCTNLLYHFPPMMAILGKLTVNSNWTTAEVIDRPAFVRLMFDGEIFSLTIHFALASLAVGAFGLFALYARREAKDDGEQTEGKRIARVAALVAIVVSVLQLPVGIWVLATLPGQARNMLMGGELLSSLLLVCGMILTFIFLQHLAGVALGDTSTNTLRRVSLLLVVLVVFMTATLRATRVADAQRSAIKSSRGNKVSTAAESTQVCSRPAWS